MAVVQVQVSESLDTFAQHEHLSGYPIPEESHHIVINLIIHPSFNVFIFLRGLLGNRIRGLLDINPKSVSTVGRPVFLRISENVFVFARSS